MNSNTLQQFYQIGELSKISNVPIRTLHHYDKIGLLKPAKVDPDSNYRYYSHKQLLEISTIKYFKVAGFSLKEIKTLLDHQDLDYSQTMIQHKMAQLEFDILKLSALKNKLHLYLQEIGKSTVSSSPDILIKELPIIHVAYSRYTGPCNPNEFMLRFTKLNNLVDNYGLFITGTMMAIYHDDYRTFDYDNADIEVCVEVGGTNKSSESVKEFGGFLCAVSHHYGSYSTMSETYKVMLDWLSKNGFIFTGEAMENYIVDAITTKNEDEYITEIILPINKNN